MWLLIQNVVYSPYRISSAAKETDIRRGTSWTPSDGEFDLHIARPSLHLGCSSDRAMKARGNFSSLAAADTGTVTRPCRCGSRLEINVEPREPQKSCASLLATLIGAVTRSTPTTIKR